MAHAFQLLFIDCNYPRAFVWWIGMHAVMFFFLFKSFYNQTYSKKKKTSIHRETENGTVTNGHLRNMDDKNGIMTQNGIKKITDVNDYYVSCTPDSRIKSE